MRCYLGLARANGAQLICKSEVIGIEKAAGGYRVDIRDSEGISNLKTRIVINCAGLRSDKVAAMVGIDTTKEGYQHHYFKGEYYTIGYGKSQRMNQRLIYPMLLQSGLVGIHTVLDIDGRVRLGPDLYPVDEINYSINESRKHIFYEGVQRLFPFVEYEDIEPESTGIMPRLYAKNEKFKEFTIRHEQAKNLTGFINLVGIESPGLTASLAIAKHVSTWIDDILKN
jgi:L-2-hydroxyglutarate oxidase LhgO